MDENLILYDEFEDCCIGLVERFGVEPFVVYDREKVIAVLESWGMTNEEAEEYFSFNVIGAWVGETTPGFITQRTVQQLRDELGDR